MNKLERAAMQQALEALAHKRSCAYKRIDQNPSECTCGVTEALTAMREALAGDNLSPTEQEEQEPVAWVKFQNGEITHAELSDGSGSDMDLSDWTPLYAAPVRTKDLTDVEIRAMFNGYVAPEILLMFRVVIAADREKNK